MVVLILADTQKGPIGTEMMLFWALGLRSNGIFCAILLSQVSWITSTAFQAWINISLPTGMAAFGLMLTLGSRMI
jgi:hypothetical protein